MAIANYTIQYKETTFYRTNLMFKEITETMYVKYYFT